MAQSMKTEHAGPKRGNGAWRGRKAEAKHVSNRRRRMEDGSLAREARMMTFDEAVEDAFRRYPKVLDYLGRATDDIVRETEDVDARVTETEASIEAGARRSGHRLAL